MKTRFGISGKAIPPLVVPSRGTVLGVAALLIFVAICWVPSFSLAQSRKASDNSQRIDGVEDREAYTEWLQDHMERRAAKAEDFEDKRYSGLDARIAVNEKSLQHSREVESIAESMATFMKWILGICLPAMSAGMWWGVKWIVDAMKKTTDKMDRLSADHKAMRADIRRSRHTTLNVLGVPLLSMLETSNPIAARQLEESLERLKTESQLFPPEV